MIFVDTSYWYAQQIPRDRRHAQAQLLEAAFGTTRLCTSSAVVGETWTLLRRRGSHAVATRWLDWFTAAPLITCIRLDEELEHEAWAWLRIHDERPYSFVDATSFALMRKHRITDALAFDGDFAAAGFTELRA